MDLCGPTQVSLYGTVSSQYVERGKAYGDYTSIQLLFFFVLGWCVCVCGGFGINNGWERSAGRCRQLMRDGGEAGRELVNCFSKPLFFKHFHREPKDKKKKEGKRKNEEEKKKNKTSATVRRQKRKKKDFKNAIVCFRSEGGAVEW